MEAAGLLSARAAALAIVLSALGLAGCVGTPAPGPEGLVPAGAAGFSTTAVFPGVYDTAGPYARPLVEGAFGILDPEVVELASDLDGATIQIGIVRPDVPEGMRVPVILDASPYYDPFTPERVRENPHNDQIVWWTFDHYADFAESFVPHGYAVAFLAIRGSGGSGGCHEGLSAATQADIDQGITWLAGQPWSNGNVGMIGISYEGSTQWMAAASGNPHLKTIVPVANAGPPTFLGALGNGTGPSVDPQGDLHFYLYGLGVEAGAVRDPLRMVRPLEGRSASQRAEGVACPHEVRGQAAWKHMAATLERDPLGYWDEREERIRDRVEADYRGTVFVVNGVDHRGDMRMFPWINGLQERGVVVKTLLGRWGHSYPDHRIFEGQDEASKRWDFAEILLRWFDRWLKEDTTVDLGPAVQVQDSEGRWRSEERWPPRDAVPVPFYLAGDGAITRDPSSAPTQARLCTAVAGTALPGTEPCEPSLRLVSGAFREGLRFAGPSTLHLAVTPSGPGGQVWATLSVEGGEGQLVVGRAAIDLRVADGEEGPRPVVPGEPRVARMWFSATDVAVPPGGRLVLDLGLPEVASAYAGIYPSVDASTALAPVEVALGGDASVLTVHAFERAPGDFFEPPGAGA